MPSSSSLNLFFLFETKVVSVFWFSGNMYYTVLKECCPTNYLYKQRNVTVKVKSQLTLLPLSHNIHYRALCRSKNRAALNLCGSYLVFYNLRHMFQRTGYLSGLVTFVIIVMIESSLWQA